LPIAQFDRAQKRLIHPAIPQSLIAHPAGILPISAFAENAHFSERTSIKGLPRMKGRRRTPSDKKIGRFYTCARP